MLNGHSPPLPQANLFRDHCFFTCFSFYGFFVAMFKFFDRVQAKNIFGFFLNAFKSTFIHSTHVSTTVPLGMIFKHLKDLFNIEDQANNFSWLFPICEMNAIVNHELWGSCHQPIEL